MTTKQIAKDLGIKITRAKEGTEMFECWADRVLEAHSYLWMANNEPLHSLTGGAYAEQAMAAKIEANKYAV